MSSQRHAILSQLTALLLTPLAAVAAAGSLSPLTNPPQETWVLRTADTQLKVGVSSDQQLCIYELSDPAGPNWTIVPSVLPLLERVDVAGASITPVWKYRQGTVDKRNGVQLTMVYTSAKPALELTAVWQAHAGPGPVHLSMFISNKSDKVVTIYDQESLKFWFRLRARIRMSVTSVMMEKPPTVLSFTTIGSPRTTARRSQSRRLQISSRLQPLRPRVGMASTSAGSGALGAWRFV